MSKLERVSEVIAVVGAQWGDEGKGKIVDRLAENADVVIRAQGGDNAGHTVVNGNGKFKLHLVPAGILNSDTQNIIGPGVALNPETLDKEITELTARGVDISGRLWISEKTHLAFPYHLEIDKMQEKSRGKEEIGTTKRGIGPTYMDKAERIGLQARLLRNPDDLISQLEKVLDKKRKHLDLDLEGINYKVFELDFYQELLKEWCKQLGPMVVDTDEIVERWLENGSSFLIEGAHGTLLDLDHGTYPMVTSSNCTVGGLLVGAGMPPIKLTKVVGVFKAYYSRVGEGWMPTELKGDQGELIRQRGQEYGTTTGRPRRIGYFDGVAAHYAQRINGFTDIAITRLDTLSEVGPLSISTNYRLDGKLVDRFPVDDQTLSKCSPVYTKDSYEWRGDLSGIRDIKDMPDETRSYIAQIMKFLPNSRLSFLGVGERREDLIVC